MAIWQPTTFLRYVRTVQSSSRTALIETDAGAAYFKAINNPEGVHILACDWFGTNLARHFGLPTFDVAVLELTELDEIHINGKLAQIGSSFVARAESGITMGGEKALSYVTNLDVLAKIIVFDIWTKNCDRYAPGLGQGGKARVNLDNLFLSEETAEKGKFILKPIDFGHIITCGRELSPRVADINQIREERIYGFFPFFKSHVSREQLIKESSELSKISSDIWQDLLQKIPFDWEVSQDTKNAIDRFLKDRARFLSENFPRMLPIEPEQVELDFTTKEENKNE
jgi:hypothetical protein